MPSTAAGRPPNADAAMPFDPLQPAAGSPLSSQVMREQLVALHEEITSIPQGPVGPAGEAGPTGPPFASAVVDGTTTLDPGQNATVSVGFDGSQVHFAFGLPRGADGGTGPSGPPGEVTQAALDSAIAGTARNPSTIAPLIFAISDPPTQAEVQALLDAHNALLAALLR